jgi:DNA repair exonuclease SbcCD ATPase subunit
MKRLILLTTLIGMGLVSFGQSKTTQDFHKKHQNAFTLFFYNNTLKMYIPEDNQEFTEMIKDLEKVKVVKIDKVKDKFSKTDYATLVKNYKDEKFEDLMSMNKDGSDIQVYIKEKNGKTLGLVILMNEKDSLTIVDILGSIPFNKIAEFAMKVENKDFN